MFRGDHPAQDHPLFAKGLFMVHLGTHTQTAMYGRISQRLLPGRTAVMRECWAGDPEARPTFGAVMQRVKPRDWNDCQPLASLTLV